MEEGRAGTSVSVYQFQLLKINRPQAIEGEGLRSTQASLRLINRLTNCR